MTFKAFPARAEASRRSLTLAGSGAAVATALTYGIGRFAASVTVGAANGSGPSFDPTGEIAAAAVVGASLPWLTRRVTGSSAHQTATLAALLFASVAAVMIEGSVFAPTLSPTNVLLVGLVLQLAVSLASAWVAVLAAGKGASAMPGNGRELRSVGSRLAGAVLIYVVAYFVTGAINYVLVTGPYYQAHAGGLTTSTPAIVLGVALTEGLLLTVGAIPLATTFAGSGRARALATGAALWILGGLVPLLQEASLSDVIRVASAAEILFQKVPLGIAVAWLFAPTPVRTAGVAGDLTRRRGPR